jgi:hypothetical protein
VAQTAQTPMSVYNFNLFPNNDIAEYREEGKDCWKGCSAVNVQEWYIVDFEAIGKVSYAGSFFVGMGDDYNFVSAIDELGRKLIDMTFDTSWLGKEPVADHGNIVRHGGVDVDRIWCAGLPVAVV